MNEEYLTTDEAFKAMINGQKLEGNQKGDYCYYDPNYSYPFRYALSDGQNYPLLESTWITKHNKWQVFEPMYEYLWMDLRTPNDYDLPTNKYMTEEEANTYFGEQLTYFKVEKTKRLRK
ncbi:MAG: hypothetical protein WC179_06870 [Candidatus Cloacimonadaceae bacterium]